MSHIRAMLAQRQRDVWQENAAKLSGKIAAGKLQPTTFRAFYRVSTDRNFEIPLTTGQNDTKISLCENLLPTNRLAQVFSMGLGICKVPLVGGIEGVPQWALAKYISNPFDAELTANEQKAANALFNAILKLHTQQSDRFDALPASEFMISNGDEAAYTIKHTPLNANFLVVGGEDNYVGVKMPSVGDFATDLTSPTTYRFYWVVESKAIIIAADEANSKDGLAAFLRSN